MSAEQPLSGLLSEFIMRTSREHEVLSLYQRLQTHYEDQSSKNVLEDEGASEPQEWCEEVKKQFDGVLVPFVS